VSKPLNLTGQRSGRLVAIEIAGKGLRRENLWSCKCDCGRVVAVAAAPFKRGNVASCGCLFRESRGGNTKHGGSNERLYSIWKTMLQRCSNPSRRAYRHYGGRGIKVCAAWSDYSAFREWALGSGYRADLTIDRIDADAGYSPANCRWASRKAQSGNRRNCIYVEVGSERLCLAHAAEKVGLKASTVYRRVYDGWTINRALNRAI
jgi:hypothetical protein